MRPEDRRSTPRYAPAVDRTQMGWWAGGLFRTAPARLQDISVGGAALNVDGGAPEGLSVWVCLAGQGPTEWVQASVAGVSPGEEGTLRFRLSFPESCPYDVFKASAWGISVTRSPLPPEAAPGTESPGPEIAGGLRARGIPDEVSPTAGLSFVVLASPVFQPSPTLVEAERALRPGKDRAGVLPWALTFVMSLLTVGLLGFVVAERLRGVRLVEAILSAARGSG